MNDTKNNPLDQLDNSYIALLAKQLNIVSVFDNVNIETIEDEATRIICRTLIGSAEALSTHLERKV